MGRRSASRLLTTLMRGKKKKGELWGRFSYDLLSSSTGREEGMEEGAALSSLRRRKSEEGKFSRW